jgi:YidC/Oxa1 family membrane protein insertase
MEHKNVLIAFVLILVVWVGMTYFSPLPEKTQTTDQTRITERQAEGLSKDIPDDDDLEPLAVTERVPLIPSGSLVEKDLVVETDTYLATFTTSGARLKSFILKKYQQTPAVDSAEVSLVQVEKNILSTLRTTGQGDFDLSSETVFSISIKDEHLILQPGEQRQVTFSADTPRGLRVDKIFTFRGSEYDFDLEIKVTNSSSQALRGGLNLALVHPWDESMAGDSHSFVGPAVYQNEKVHTYKVKKIEKEAIEFGSDAVWTAFEREYFMSAVAPKTGAGEKFRIVKTGDAVENIIETPFLVLKSGEQVEFQYLLYYGPRDLDILEKVDHQLEKAIDFGFFGLIARPLLWVLKYFYQYVGNYGVAIILLTGIIKLIFWPLTQKSYKSMKSMQNLQPEMQKIREKFKTDKERMNKEIMGLYKTNRVNPAGGCLPMLVQIPVFFALYKVLLGTIELRHAPFIFWIQDLAAKDPYYITPIIMGATMFLQQKMSPTTMDPNQAKIFMFMPLIFTFMFLNFPSGLVLYWLVNNLLTILQQWFIHRGSKTAAA